MGDEFVGTTIAGEVANNGSLGSECEMFGGDTRKCTAILVMKRLTASISIIGCVFMISVIWLFKKYTQFTQRLILYLSCAAFCNCIVYLMGSQIEDGHWCNFKAWLLTYTNWTVLLWVCIVTFNLYMTAVREVKTDKYEIMYHGVCWGIPFPIACSPLFGDHYGPAGMWCWIEINQWPWRFGVYYIPLFVILAILWITYILIFITIRRKITTWQGIYGPDIARERELLKQYIKPLMYYPCVYLALSIFPLINRIQDAITMEELFPLALLSVIFAPLKGAANAIVFGLDKETRRRLTYHHIKLALLSRHPDNEQPVIREYPMIQQIDDPTQPQHESHI